MKIGIDGRCLQDSPRTGVGEAAFHLIKNLASVRSDIRLFVFLNAYGSIDINFGEANIGIIKKNIPNKLLNGSLKFFKKPFLDSFFNDIDLFFAPNWNFISLSRRLPFVLTVHDLSVFLYPEFYSPYSRFWHKKLLNIKRLIQRADRIIVPSRATKNDLLNMFRGVERKVSVISWGIDCPAGKSANYEPRVSNSDGYILFLATLEERKNVRGLIAAYEYARERKIIDDNISLTLAGPFGYGFSKIKKMAGDSRFSRQIKICGPVNDEQKKKLYSEAAAFAYPSFYEGFGLPPLEAMAFGVPVITSSVSSLGEIFRNAAILVQPYQTAELAAALGHILNDDNLRRKYIERGLNLAREFQWKSAADKLFAVFEDVSGSGVFRAGET